MRAQCRQGFLGGTGGTLIKSNARMSSHASRPHSPHRYSRVYTPRTWPIEAHKGPIHLPPKSLSVEGIAGVNDALAVDYTFETESVLAGSGADGPLTPDSHRMHRRHHEWRHP